MTLPTPTLATMPLAEASYWLPVQASEFAPRIDWVFYFILGISVIFFVLITVLMVYFAVRYRARPEEISKSTITHNTKLELTWSIIPSIIVIIIFFYGFIEYLDAYTPPADAYEVFVDVEDESWVWTFTYPNGVQVTGKEGVVFPVNENIRLVMTSQDYIHSFFVPEFRVKRDLMPGRYTHTWFKATRKTARAEDDPELEEDEYYNLFCAEYCGRNHSLMTGEIKIWSRTDFDAWMAEQVERMEDPDPFEAGRRVFAQRCAVCHSTEDEVDTGPGLGPLFAEPREVIRSEDGERLTFDYATDPEAFENYVREAILEPLTYTSVGFEGEAGTMPSFRGQLREQELRSLIIYMKSLADPEQAMIDRLTFLREFFPERYESMVEELREDPEVDVDRLIEQLPEPEENSN